MYWCIFVYILIMFNDNVKSVIIINNIYIDILNLLIKIKKLLDKN